MAKSDKVKKSADEQETEVNVRRVSHRKVIYIDIDDEITSVYDRVKRQKMSDVYLVVPQRAVLLQSIVNLKILKRKISDIGKTLYIITNDKSGVKLAIQAGLTVFDRVDELTKKYPSRAKFVEKSAQDISPLKAASNSMDDERPKRLKEKKISIHSIIERHKKGWFSVSNVFQKAGMAKNVLKRPKVKKNLHIFSRQQGVISALVVLSVGVLLLISYIALPDATLYLTPKSNVRSVSVNITLADYEKNSGELSNRPTHMIASYPVSTLVAETMDYQATGREFNGQNARGRLNVINDSTREWPLVAGTRFQTQDGLVYRSEKAVNVPPKRAGQAGTLEVQVVADEYDVNGQIVGDRGNIGPSEFFLPGLKTKESQSLLFAKSDAPMSGGTSDAVVFVTEEDIESAGAKIKHQIEISAETALEEYVKQKSATDKTRYELLRGGSAISYGNFSAAMPNDILGSRLTSFKVSGEMEVFGVMYNHEEFMSILKRELRNSKSPDKKLVTIDEESVSYDVIERNEDVKRVKITAQIKGVEEYEIDPEEENGKRLIESILNRIKGMHKDEAYKRLLNMTEIDKVEIKLSPFWIPSLPKVVDHIEVEIRR